VLDAVNIGRGTVQRELQNLTDAGIINRRVEGRQVYYQANNRCPLFNELKSIVRKTFGVADVIARSLALARDKIRVAFIFGSVARSADNRRSDIDLMIVGRISFEQVVSLLSPAEEELGREVNPVVYSVAEFKKKVTEDHYFIKRVVEEEKIFIAGDKEELQKLKSSTGPAHSYRFDVPEAELAAFCRRHHIKKLSLFGSVLRDDFNANSDIDVLVEFEPGYVPGFGMVDMENELSQLAGYKVDLRTPHDLSRYFRDRVVREAKVQYAEA
jgi:predicted nucleotidyltransferase